MQPPLKARVENGRLKLDEPTDLPEGTVIELVPADEALNRNDDLTNEQRVYVHGEIIASMRERCAGGATFDADDVMDDLAPKS